MTTYIMWNRITNEGTEITEDQAKIIYNNAPYKTGEYGYMGKGIDKVLYKEIDNDSESYIMAVCYNNEWLAIPENQTPFMEAELGFNSYEFD